VLFQFLRRVTPYRVLVTLNLIDKAGAKPLQITIGKAFSFCVGAFDEHLHRYDRLNERPQSGSTKFRPQRATMGGSGMAEMERLADYYRLSNEPAVP
jgi:hypothetical protein